MRPDVDRGEQLSLSVEALGPAIARTAGGVGQGEAAVRLPQIAGAEERDRERVNHKRLYRVYREAGLCLRWKKRKHCVRSGLPLSQTTAANQEWALDFAHDVIAAGRVIRVFSVVDTFTRECLAL